MTQPTEYPTMRSHKRICASCRNGWEGKGNKPYEDDNGYCPDWATLYVQGRSANGLPYRAFLCEAHSSMMEMDGALWNTVNTLVEPS